MIWIWIAFIAFVLLMLALDLRVFHRKAHVVSVKEAIAWSAVWIAMGLAFAVFVYFAYESKWFGLGTAADAVDGVANGGATATEKYLTGYVVEKSLSVDNIFVFALIFGFFAVPPKYQHRVLFWGVLGALVLRALFIAAGAVALEAFHGVIYLFGAILLLTGLKLLFARDHEEHPERNPLFRLFRKLVPTSSEYEGDRFFTRVNGRRMATPAYRARFPAYVLAGTARRAVGRRALERPPVAAAGASGASSRAA